MKYLLIIMLAAMALSGCAALDTKKCVVERVSADPKMELTIWEPADCPKVVAPVVRNDKDGGDGWNPPTVEEPKPTPDPDPKPDPKPDPEPPKNDHGDDDHECKGKCGGEKPGHGHRDHNHHHSGPPGKSHG